MNSNIRELSNKEIGEVNGGFIPVIAAGAAFMTAFGNGAAAGAAFAGAIYLANKYF